MILKTTLNDLDTFLSLRKFWGLLTMLSAQIFWILCIDWVLYHIGVHCVLCISNYVLDAVDADGYRTKVLQESCYFFPPIQLCSLTLFLTSILSLLFIFPCHHFNCWFYIGFFSIRVFYYNFTEHLEIKVSFCRWYLWGYRYGVPNKVAFSIILNVWPIIIITAKWGFAPLISLCSNLSDAAAVTRIGCNIAHTYQGSRDSTEQNTLVR